MKQNTKLHRNLRRRAFTLIELIVVILILAILATLVVPKVVGRTSDAKIAAAKTDIAQLHSAFEAFRIDTDRYPASQEGVNALMVAPSDVRNWKGPYLNKLVTKDPWGNEYIYEYPGSNGSNTFTLMSYGADGQPGGDVDAADIVDGQD